MAKTNPRNNLGIIFKQQRSYFSVLTSVFKLVDSKRLGDRSKFKIASSRLIFNSKYLIYISNVRGLGVAIVVRHKNLKKLLVSVNYNVSFSYPKYQIS